jgi:microcystin-dependent protein
MARRSYAGGAVPTTLTVLLDAVSLSATVAAFTLWPSGAGGNFVVTLGRGTSTEEKVLCSATSGTALTIVSRGYDGTTAQSHSISTVVEHTISAIDLDEANAHVNATTGVHGLGGPDGSVVGTTKVQTLTGKSIDGGTNTLTNIPRTASPQLQADIAAEAVARAAADLALIPPGTIIAFAGAAAPAGYLACDGSSQLIASYTALSTAIRATWGGVDGTHFNLPNLGGRVARGVGGAYTAGTTGGADTHTLIAGNLPPHAHGGVAHTHTTPITSVGGFSADHNHGFSAAFSTNSDGDHSHTVLIGPVSAFANTTASSPGQIVGATASGRVNQAIPSSGNTASHAHGGTVSGATNNSGINHTHDLPAMTTASGGSSTDNGPGTSTAINHADLYGVVLYCIKT